MKLYRYWKSSFQYLWTNAESILDHQQRVHTLRTFISCHAISTGPFFCQVTFLCVIVSSSSTEWNGLGLHHPGLYYAPTAWICLWFPPSDVYFSLICLKTTESFSDGFLAEKLFPCVVKGSKYIQFGTKFTENSCNSQRNLAISHLGWSQKCPMGWTESNFSHFFQTGEKDTASSFFRGHSHDTWWSTQHPLAADSVFCIQENQPSGSYLVA